MSGWVVVVCKPNCENIAVANLRQQGYLTYYPRLKQIQPDKSFRIRPLFPRYIFTYIRERWYSLRSTYGVSYILMNEQGPAIISAGLIDEIKSREENGFVTLNRVETFKLGDPVKTLDGPLAGRLLTYEGLTSRARVKVLISMLGRQCPAVVDEKSLVAA